MVSPKVPKSALRSLALPALLTLAAVIILVSLGNWQMRRLAWKQDLIAQVATRPAMAVAVLPPSESWPDLIIDELEYRPFQASGRLDAEKTALVFTSLPDPKGPYGGPGYWVVTPLTLSDGGQILINRGFVPHGRQDDPGLFESPDEMVDFVGLLRRPDPGGLFRPDDQPADNRFHARNPARIAQAKGLVGPVAPFTLDALKDYSGPDGLPQAGESRTHFANSHLEYALTWYGLAAAAIGVFAAFSWRRLKQRDGEETA